MLRALVLALLLANLGFCAWTQGWLDNLIGVRARGDHEPERLARQVRPEAILILPPGAARAAPPPPPPAPVAACLEAGPFDTAQVAAAETLLKSTQPPLPEHSWIDVKSDHPGNWIVYMGKYPTIDAMSKKEDELKRRDVTYEEVQAPTLKPGLSLGSFDEKRLADDALAVFSKQGIRTAHVVQATPPTSTHMLRAESADAALAARLAGLKGDALVSGFVTCGKASTAGN